MKSLRFPDPYKQGRLDEDDGKLKERGNRYVLSMVWFTVFEHTWLLRGLDNALVDPYLDRENFFRLQRKILDINLGMIDQWLERKVDGNLFSDD